MRYDLLGVQLSCFWVGVAEPRCPFWSCLWTQYRRPLKEPETSKGLVPLEPQRDCPSSVRTRPWSSPCPCAPRAWPERSWSPTCGAPQELSSWDRGCSPASISSPGREPNETRRWWRESRRWLWRRHRDSEWTEDRYPEFYKDWWDLENLDVAGVWTS